jgi:16S rRNA (guanine527-N7)-methyltransferase
MTVGDLAARLREGLAALDLALSDGQQQHLLAYLQLIAKWNKVYNLTAVRDPQDMLVQHLLDSLAIVSPLVRHTGGAALRVLDVGAGAGLPGVVIAICRPELTVDCVDTVAKKAAFVQQVAASLGLANLKGVHARVESLEGPYALVTSRAFASLADFTAWSASALAPGGIWLAMKGKHPADEIAALPVGIEVFHVEPLRVPGMEADRCIIWMRKGTPVT